MSEIGISNTILNPNGWGSNALLPFSYRYSDPTVCWQYLFFLSWNISCLKNYQSLNLWSSSSFMVVFVCRITSLVYFCWYKSYSTLFWEKAFWSLFWKKSFPRKNVFKVNLTKPNRVLEIIFELNTYSGDLNAGLLRYSNG